jgi:hypothetical protein
MPVWKGIVGRGFRSAAFKDYVGTLSFTDWRPQFVVVHNTSEPTAALYRQWQTRPGWTGEQWLRNLEGFYRDTQQWSAGPHLFIAEDFIWAFTPLTTSGVHSPSWNGISWGLEMVGEFETEPFTAAVRENTVDALAILHAWRGLDPGTIRFHKEDPRTTHKSCPGRNVDKAELISRVHDRMAQADPGEHPAPGAAASSITDAAPAPASGPVAVGLPAGNGRFTNILATEFGGGPEAGMASAYGGKVDPNALQVALPARLPSNKRQIRVFHLPSGNSVVCKVNDIGPWNTTDKYWQAGGRPLVETQFRNRTSADDGEVPTNDAGIDLTPAVFAAFGIGGPINTRQTHVDWEFV